MKNGIALAAALLVAACAPVQSVTQRHTEGQPLEYRLGFENGCSSGYVAAGHPYSRWDKDVVRYNSVEQYRQGWDDGMAVCKGDYESIGRAMRR